MRDGKGEFTGIRPIAPRRPAARPGLAVGLQTPRGLTPGRQATVLVSVGNRRRAASSRVASSLWHVRITAAIPGARARTVRVNELRARRGRTWRVRLPVPRAPRRRVCVQVTAAADSARAARATRCAQIEAGPPFTG